MALPWKSLFKELPANNEIVWIRVLNIYGELTLAKFKKNQEKFIVETTDFDIPMYQVARWKSQ